MANADNNDDTRCPVCDAVLEKDWQGNGGSKAAYAQDCPNCGHYYVTPPRLDRLDNHARAALSHEIWKSNAAGPPPFVEAKMIEAAKQISLPNPAEQLDLYILFIGDSQENSPGSKVVLETANIRAKTGALTKDDVVFINSAAKDGGLLQSMGSMTTCGGRLTLKGWQCYRELKRGKTDGHTAFMAMPFGKKEVVDIVDNVFRAAVEETGFKLKRLDDEAPAGLIDNRLRVEIRMCRLLIVDLTDENRGAYWEAGYAEGLGKPVIFTCSEAYFDANKTHFDTNHQHTILWNPKEPKKAAEDLKSTIRATLPFEAKMPKE